MIFTKKKSSDKFCFEFNSHFVFVFYQKFESNKNRAGHILYWASNFFNFISLIHIGILSNSYWVNEFSSN